MRGEKTSSSIKLTEKDLSLEAFRSSVTRTRRENTLAFFSKSNSETVRNRPEESRVKWSLSASPVPGDKLKDKVELLSTSDAVNWPT